RLVERGVLTRSATAGARPVYQLTDKGLDLYPVPLAMLTWGDRWLTGGDPPITLSHKACGHRLRAILTCSNCPSPITRADLAVTSNDSTDTAGRGHVPSLRRAPRIASQSRV